MILQNWCRHGPGASNPLLEFCPARRQCRQHGLADPLVLAFYFTAQSDSIVQLTILRNRFNI
jgi:hypothetical protein